MKIYKHMIRESRCISGVEYSVLEDPKGYDKMPTFNKRVLSLNIISLFLSKFYIYFLFFDIQVFEILS